MSEKGSNFPDKTEAGGLWALYTLTEICYQQGELNLGVGYFVDVEYLTQLFLEWGAFGEDVFCSETAPF